MAQAEWEKPIQGSIRRFYFGGWSGIKEMPSALKRWGPRHFKILDDADVELAPLTVLTGTNSSGKSSYIQSLLMLAQSAGDSVELNGPCVSLGEPEDVIGQGFAELVLTWTVAPATDGWEWGDADACHCKLVLRRERGRLVPQEFTMALEVFGPVISAKVLREGESRGIAIESPQLDDEVQQHEFKGDRLAVRSFFGQPPTGWIELMMTGLFVEGLVLEEPPEQFLKRFEAYYGGRNLTDNPIRAEQLVKELEIESDEGVIDSEMLDDYLFILDAPNPMEMLQECADTDILPHLLRDLVYKTRITTSAFEVGKEGKFDYFGFPAEQSPYADFGVLVDQLKQANELLRQAASSIVYLGPLRSDPADLSSSASAPSFAPVGTKGEFAARVLAENEGPYRGYIGPGGGQHSGSLKDGVAAWAKYLELGDAINAERRGRHGHAASIEVNGKERDLSEVGVGVSQVLPVLVLAMIAKPGSIVLIEQPELHLHPAAQSRLADLFLYARPDVTFVVETHSEYLITRLRRRVVEGKANPSKIAIYFAEVEGGQSELVRLNLSDRGNFDEWPTGFFDTRDQEVLRLAQALRERRETGP